MVDSRHRASLEFANAGRTLATLPRDLRALEGAGPVGLAAAIFSDERPLLGVPSLVDFRLAGRLGQALRTGALTGAFGERFLMPLGRRVAVPWLLLVGLGPRASFHEDRAEAAFESLFDAIDGLQWATAAIEPPGLAAGLTTDDQALSLFGRFGARTDGIFLVLPPRAATQERTSTRAPGKVAATNDGGKPGRRFRP